MEGSAGKIEWQALGRVHYGEAFSFQEMLRVRRISGEIADRILLLEHPPVITMGRRDCSGDILSHPNELREAGIEVVKTNRGGRATYHGPGQLMGYLILSLDGLRMGIRDLVNRVEEICLATLADFGVSAGRDEENPGLWVGRNKVVAIGMNVSRGVTQHGFAMNVGGDLGAYRHIVACGLAGRGVTSIEREIGARPDVAGVASRFIEHAGATLGREMVRLVD